MTANPAHQRVRVRRLFLRSYKILAAGLAAALLLSGCSLTEEYFGESEEAPLEGKREAILETGRGAVPDVDLGLVPVIVPPQISDEWPTSGRNAAHAGGNLAWSSGGALAWSSDAGTGSRDAAQRVLSTPIVSNGRIFVLDAVLEVHALDAQTGSRIWSAETAPEDEEDGFGGGLVSDGAVVYVAGGHGKALALNASDGSVRWQVDLPGPVRSAPALAGGLLLATTADNTIIALNTEDGTRAWIQRGVSEATSMLGSPAPAVANDAVISALTNGDLVVMRASNGRELWRSSLGSVRRFDFGTKLSDIVGLPAVADNILYATSSAGRTAALSLRAGSRIWEQRLGGMSSPWIAGDFLYMVTDKAELVCLFRPDGRVRWAHALQRFEDPEDRTGALFYAGPVMAGGRLALTRSDGTLLLHNPENGAQEATLNIGSRTLQPPIVAGGTLYTLSEDGTLSAFR